MQAGHSHSFGTMKQRTSFRKSKKKRKQVCLRTLRRMTATQHREYNCLSISLKFLSTTIAKTKSSTVSHIYISLSYLIHMFVIYTYICHLCHLHCQHHRRQHRDTTHAIDICIINVIAISNATAIGVSAFIQYSTYEQDCSWVKIPIT